MTVRPLILLLVGSGCEPDNIVQKAEPSIVVEPATIDFGETVINTTTEIGAVIRNDGLGALRIDAAEIGVGSSADFTLVSFPAELAAHEEGLLVIDYTPDIEGGDWGTVSLTTNQTGSETYPVSLLGIGVRPCIDIDPELLSFGTVAPGESATKNVTVRAGCSGDLVVAGTAFSGAEAGAYSVVLGDSWVAPFEVENSTSFEVAITFAPPDANEWSGELWFLSNDPDEPISAVQLVGNSVDDPTENVAPVCELTEPDVGEYIMDDRVTTMTGSVYDEDEPVTNLTCKWSVDGTKIASSDPDSEGVVVAAELLPEGDIALTLTCYDSEGLYCEDTTSLKVWNHEEPVEYTITGGDSIFDYFAVDDDISIELNGVPLYRDNNDTQDNLAPVVFSADLGDSLRIIVEDYAPTETRLDALQLHWGTGSSQSLNDAMCMSSSPAHSCYDGTYSPIWPNAALDETFTITIP